MGCLRSNEFLKMCVTSLTFNADNLMIACKALWGIKDNDLDNNYINICKAKINNTLSFYQSFKSDYYNNIKRNLNQYLGRDSGITQELAEFFKGSNDDDEGITISNMVSGYNTIKKDSFFPILHSQFLSFKLSFFS